MKSNGGMGARTDGSRDADLYKAQSRGVKFMRTVTWYYMDSQVFRSWIEAEFYDIVEVNTTLQVRCETPAKLKFLQLALSLLFHF